MSLNFSTTIGRNYIGFRMESEFRVRSYHRNTLCSAIRIQDIHDHQFRGIYFSNCYFVLSYHLLR